MFAALKKHIGNKDSIDREDIQERENRVIEFILEGDNVYPEDYPAEGAEITIQGVFGTYEEDGGTYWSLTGARFI